MLQLILTHKNLVAVEKPILWSLSNFNYLFSTIKNRERNNPAAQIDQTKEFNSEKWTNFTCKHHPISGAQVTTNSKFKFLYLISTWSPQNPRFVVPPRGRAISRQRGAKTSHPNLIKHHQQFTRIFVLFNFLSPPFF